MDKSGVEIDDFEYAIERVIGGVEKKSHVLSKGIYPSSKCSSTSFFSSFSPPHLCCESKILQD